MTNPLRIISFEPDHFADVIELGNLVHGDNYLSLDGLAKMHKMSFRDGINASFVAYLAGQLIGFRLTYAAGNWPVDQWCTPQLWGHPVDKVCYFKCNTVDEIHRGQGIGAKLLSSSIDMTKKQGSTAGLAHIWLQSPGNSAFKYMTRAGGKIIKIHPERWLESSLVDGYYCVTCQGDCHCDAAEMLLEFK